MPDDPDAETWLPLAEAAAQLGLSRSQLRRRIRAGQIASRQIPGPHGPAYEVRIVSADPDVTVTSTARHANDRHPAGSVTVTPPLAELVALIRDLQADVVSKAEAAAMWQARAEYLATQVEQLQRALPDPSKNALRVDSDGLSIETTRTSSETPRRAPWWRRWLLA